MEELNSYHSFFILKLTEKKMLGIRISIST